MNPQTHTIELEQETRGSVEELRLGKELGHKQNEKESLQPDCLSFSSNVARTTFYFILKTIY